MFCKKRLYKAYNVEYSVIYGSVEVRESFSHSITLFLKGLCGFWKLDTFIIPYIVVVVKSFGRWDYKQTTTTKNSHRELI